MNRFGNILFRLGAFVALACFALMAVACTGLWHWLTYEVDPDPVVLLAGAASFVGWVGRLIELQWPTLANPSNSGSGESGGGHG